MAVGDHYLLDEDVLNVSGWGEFEAELSQEVVGAGVEAVGGIPPE